MAPYRLVAFVILMTQAGGTDAFADSRAQARSMVITRQGIAATSQTLASQAAAQILARGGSATDAAIAANATLSVVEPMMNGIGGDLFAIRRDAESGEVTGLNASGWSPQALTRDALESRGHQAMPEQGILSVSVPGCVEGWRKLHDRFGKLPWRDLFLPAIYYADQGFPVTEWIHTYWQGSESKLRSDANAAALFLPNGEVPKVGQIFRNPQLASALRLIAADGPDAFYRGAIADAIVATSNRLDGLIGGDDLSEYQAEWVTPISTDYRGWTVYELPPNGQGIAALIMLNLMEHQELGPYEASETAAVHWKIEAQKLAYQDLQRYVGDPDFSRIPVAGLISKEYAASRASLINEDKAHCDPTPGEPTLDSAGDTIYLTVVDRQGSIVSLIQSIFLSFGSGVMVDGYGFHLQNRAGLFTLEEDHPNEVAPRKRPFHTIIPGLMEKDDRYIGFGIMGGLNQAQAHAQFVSNIVDHGMNIQMALEAPRFTKLDFGGCGVSLEGRFPDSVIRQLREKGHQIEVLGDFASPMGGGQAVVFDEATGIKYGASSPRKDGAAIPEPDPYF